jgi:hypothetical protein
MVVFKNYISFTKTKVFVANRHSDMLNSFTLFLPSVFNEKVKKCALLR